MIKNNRQRPVDERIEVHHVGLENSHDWIAIKGTPRHRIGKYEHETCKGWLYVAYHRSVEDWEPEYALGGGALVADLSFLFMGKRIYLEVDRGNMEPEELFDKIDRYREFAGTGDKVIFTLQNGKYKADYIGNSIFRYCREHRLGNFITMAEYDTLINHPLDDVLWSPRDGRMNLVGLCSSPTQYSKQQEFPSAPQPAA